MLSKLFNSLSETSKDNPEELLEVAMKTMSEVDGVDAKAVSGVMDKILPNVLSALNPIKEKDVCSRKASLLDKFANIDGNIK
jgi:hypothetical protein